MNKLIGVVVLLLLVACSSEQQTPVLKEKSMLDKTIAPPLDALEKAKGVEDVLKQQQLERDKRMLEQGV